MADLSVTDVQRMLREHADFGHDVLQHPHQSIIQGKPYGMRSMAQLLVRGSGKGMDSGLTSDILQSERPLVSRVLTNPGENGFDVYPTMPHRARTGSHTALEFFTPIDNNPEQRPHTEYSTTLDNLAKTPHDALQAHITEKFPYVGTEYTGSTTLYHKNLSDYSPALDLRNVLKESQKYKVHEPFSGLITVYHHPDFNPRAYDVYGYDPSTEQLIRHV